MSTDPGSDDVFDALGVPARFALTGAEVQAAFLKQTGALRSADLDDEVREERLALVNRARKHLADPRLRGEALLVRWARERGVPVPGAPALPPVFLAEMMELREELEADLEAPKQDPARRAAWEQGAAERLRGHEERFAELAAGEASQRDLRALRDELNRWKYAARLMARLDGREVD